MTDRFEVYHILDTILTKESPDEYGVVTKEIDQIPLYVSIILICYLCSEE